MLRRHKIDILKHSTGQDDYGEPVDDWIVFKGGVWASKEDVIGKEFYSSLATENSVEKKFTTGYIKGIKSEMRIKFGDDVYEIIGNPVNMGDRNIELLFYCRLVK